MDKVILSCEWTAFVAYPLGALIGMWSLLTILMQYKTESIKLATEMQQQSSHAGHREQSNSQWVELHKQYPVLGVYVFMGIVLSTAVVQAQIAATLISLVLGLLWNCLELWLALQYFGPFLVAYVSIFAIDIIAMKCLKNYLMKENGEKIKHPRRFNFFMIVLSMVHPDISLSI